MHCITPLDFNVVADTVGRLIIQRLTVSNANKITVIPPNPRGGEPPRSRGRPPNSPNKIPASIKEMVLAALENVGGVEYLMCQAIMNPVAFMALVAKVLPLQVTGPGDGPLQIERIERVIVRVSNDDDAKA